MLYGALSNQYFKFYDARNGESTTATGRKILRHICASVGEILDGKYQEPLPDNRDKHSVVYGDTDSAYFLTHAQDLDQAVQIGDVVERKVNKSLPTFMEDNFHCTSGREQFIVVNREIISDRGIFVDKKRYCLHVCDDEGSRVDKLKIMGLELKKTILPKQIQNRLIEFVRRLLAGEEWDSIAKSILEFKKELLDTDDFMLLGLPKGINGIEEYTDKYNFDPKKARLPGHVAAGIFYNMCLKEYNDRESPEIRSGTKIKVFYLKNIYHNKFKSIVLPTDIDEIPDWFKNDFVDNIDREAQLQRLVDKPLLNILKAIGYDVPPTQDIVLQEFFEF